MTRITEVGLIISSIVSLVLITTLYSQELGIIYGIFLLGIYVMRDTDNHILFDIEKSPNRLRSLAYAVIGLFVYFGITAVVFNFLGVTSTLSVYDTVNLLSSTALPVLASSVILAAIIVIFFIPPIETEFLVKMFERIRDFLKIPIDFDNPFKTLFDLKILSIIALIAGFFVFIHLTAKYPLGNLGLNNFSIQAFIFAFVTIALLIFERQSLSANLMHVMANGIYTLKAPALAGIIPSFLTQNITIAGILLGVVFLYLFTSAKSGSFTGG